VTKRKRTKEQKDKQWSKTLTS